MWSIILVWIVPFYYYGWASLSDQNADFVNDLHSLDLRCKIWCDSNISIFPKLVTSILAVKMSQERLESDGWIY